MSALYKKGTAEIQGNLTPMIDMIFLLIVFFVLVSRIVDVRRVEMNLPQPKDAATERQTDERRLVINVLPGPAGSGAAAGYRVGSRDFDTGPASLSAMTDYLTGLYSQNPMLNVNVRADRSTHYGDIEPVLRAVAAAARRVNGAFDGATADSPSDRGSGGRARVNLVVLQEN